ncbi:MAG: pyruvate, phosphate dikinase, partial [Dongiaceae bacterium]
MASLVYSFGSGKTPSLKNPPEIVGGKGAGLIEMSRLGLPVPPGFTLSTGVCRYFNDNQGRYPAALSKNVNASLRQLEKTVGRKFGDPAKPLLLSVRSGARLSMPGMMDTILNVGLNDETVCGLIKTSHNERFAYDCYRRLIQMYGSVVMGIDMHEFDYALDAQKLSANAARDLDLTAKDLRQLVLTYKEIVKKKTGQSFPQDANEQLWGAISAVFKSWGNTRAKTYRKIYNIPEEWGTAATVQAMVFGNNGDKSATGVAFTRDPSTGEKRLYGEYLANAQGEDVVAGIRTPQSISTWDKNVTQSRHPSLEESMPKVFRELQNLRNLLEKHYRDMQDIEFTIENEKLYILQTRAGKRSAAAALKIARDMIAEKLITPLEAIKRIDAMSLDQLLHPRLDPNAKPDKFGKGLPAAPGAATGQLVFNADTAESLGQKGTAVILARAETSPEDIHGMHAAKGILTTRGGMTSHAAVVARGMGKPAVVGASQLKWNEQAKTLSNGAVTLKEGDWITIDGGKGEIYAGKIPTILPELTGDFDYLMNEADKVRGLAIRTNADTPNDAKCARKFGAEGIGLCRTEHMFFDEARINSVREMILAENLPQRQAALKKLLPLQRDDFVAIFKEMAGLPVTIRLLDPPLHEFLPHSDREIEAIAQSSGLSATKLKERAHALIESNPMLGHRGCRLGLTYPEIYAMQARAIGEATILVKKNLGKAPMVEIMIPLIATAQEFILCKQNIEKTLAEVFKESGQKIPYSIGTMIELPRAALEADKIAAAGCEFFSFGTNDLTQTTFGLSRDDAGNFLEDYIKLGIFARDPFATLDQDGVGALMQIALERGRKINPNLKIGICGEHGGDPASIAFCAKIGLDYVSCSPFRVPIARLAAAQSAAP